jgi:predicted GIY-YIG superfamily endonuclease
MSDLTLHLDFETFSEASLKLCGVYRYAMDPTTEILSCCWAVGEEEVNTWVPCITLEEARRFGLPTKDYVEDIENAPGDHTRKMKAWHYGPTCPAPLAAAVASGTTFAAHNAQFERAIWQAVVVKRHGGPRTKPQQFVCTAARSAASGLPRSLDGVGMALGTQHQKDSEGAKLLKMFAMVRKPTKHDSRKRIMPLDAPSEFKRLVQYCQQDVRTERDVDKEVPHLHPLEQKLFAFDMQINERGLFIDIPLVEKTSRVVARLESDIVAEVKRLTVTPEYPEGLRPTQRDKMMGFFQSIGVELENMQADHVRKYMKKNATRLQDTARRLLMLRMEAGKASTKKLASMMAFCGPDQRARGTLLFYGAHTGRWCLEEDTLILVRDERGVIRKRKIQHVRSTDALWDGFEWVRHAGVVASGEKEIIEHDGVRASADHEVWVSENKKMRLEDAARLGARIWRSQPWALYALTFANGKRYIGISTRPHRRFGDHVAGKTGVAVQNAVRRHGPPHMAIIRWVDGKTEAQRLEKKAIADYRTNEAAFGYNLTMGGEAGPGFKPEVQRAASAKGVARLSELRKDPAFAARLNSAVSKGTRASTAHAEANRAKSAQRRGKPSKNPDAARASFKLATLAKQKKSADMRELGLLKKQTKPVPREEKNRRIAASVKKHFQSKTPEERKAVTAAARSAVVWDDNRRRLQRDVMSRAIKEYWRKKREAQNV